MSIRGLRQSFLGADSERVLGALRVGVVGLGGGGSHIVQQLAHLGVGSFVLVDPDCIEETNLNRLVGGTAADVRAGAHKTRIAARQVRRVSPRSRVTRIEATWQTRAESLRGCDLLFGCVDSFGERRQLEEAARRYLIPYIDIGMDVIPAGDEFAIVGQVALSMPGRHCLRCFGVLRDAALAAEAQNYGVAGSRPQVVWPNGLLASAAVGIAVSLVSPWHSGAESPPLVEYDGNRGTLTPSPVLSAVSAECTHFRDANMLGDPWFGSPSHRWSG